MRAINIPKRKNVTYPMLRDLADKLNGTVTRNNQNNRWFFETTSTSPVMIGENNRAAFDYLTALVAKLVDVV